jgi:glycine C-acetyltransferase
MGKTGVGTGEHFGVQDEIDVYFATFAKSFAGIGGFVAGSQEVIKYLRFNLRSQVYAKSLPVAMTIGALKRLELLRNEPQHREKLWTIVRELQGGLKREGMNLGRTESCVTPVFLAGGLAEATNVTYELREIFNIFCSIVIYPVVPKGVIMLRLIPTAVHTLDDVAYTIEAFSHVKKQIEQGKYSDQPKVVKL